MKNLFNKQSLWPYLFLAPQLIVTIVFFILPAVSALKLSLEMGDAFGIHAHFVWFYNFWDIVTDQIYLKSAVTTLLYAAGVTIISMSFALLAANMADRVLRGGTVYKTLLIWPYAVAPAVAGILWRFLFNPAIGIFPDWLAHFGIHWDYRVAPGQALGLIIIAAAWQQFSYNFIFFLAGLQAIPQSLLEVAELDGASPLQRFITVTFPLLSPTTFYLVLMNVIYAFFDTFGIIQTVTRGGPGESTTILVYKVYNDGFMGLDLGGSSAQSVILMLMVMILTVIQFRYIERKVHYQ